MTTPRTPSPATLASRAFAKVQQVKQKIKVAEQTAEAALMKHNTKVQALQAQLAAAEIDLANYKL
jgi:hypothetical protein